MVVQFEAQSIFTSTLAASKNDASSKNDKNRLKNHHLATLI
jgi:hypothetical protein